MLFGNSGFPFNVAAIGAVVVHMNSRVSFGRDNTRLIERAGIAAGKIGAGRTAVGHEEGVADKGSVTNKMGHASWGVAGRVNGLCSHAADVVSKYQHLRTGDQIDCRRAGIRCLH